MITITIPVQLRQLSGGRDHIKITMPVAHGRRTLRLAIDLLEEECPGAKTKLLDTEGNLRRYINVYLDQRDARTVAGDQAKLNASKDSPPPEDANPLDAKLTGYEDIAILPAASGG